MRLTPCKHLDYAPDKYGPDIMMLRLRCRLIGCATGDYCPDCERCGAYIYSDEYIDRGWLYPLQWRWLVLRQYLTWRCNECGKWIKPWRRDIEGFCSQECFDRWLPF